MGSPDHCRRFWVFRHRQKPADTTRHEICSGTTGSAVRLLGGRAHVAATLTERNSPIYRNNDVESFIAGKDSYCQFEINALKTIYVVFFI